MALQSGWIRPPTPSTASSTPTWPPPVAASTAGSTAPRCRCAFRGARRCAGMAAYQSVCRSLDRYSPSVQPEQPQPPSPAPPSELGVIRWHILKNLTLSDQVMLSVHNEAAHIEEFSCIGLDPVV